MKKDIAIAVNREHNESMQDYGYNIIKTFVIDIDPDEQVKARYEQNRHGRTRESGCRIRGRSRKEYELLPKRVPKQKVGVTVKEIELN